VSLLRDRLITPLQPPLGVPERRADRNGRLGEKERTRRGAALARLNPRRLDDRHLGATAPRVESCRTYALRLMALQRRRDCRKALLRSLAPAVEDEVVAIRIGPVDDL
jgi:hypothetical protein